MSRPIEPFIHPIRIGWAHCDPAMIVYTGNIPGFALEAIDAWWEAKTGNNWFEMNVDMNTGTPFVHMTLDFRAPVTPRFMLHCEVRLLKIGTRSVRFGVKGFQDDKLCFEGEFVSVIVVADAMRPQAIPDRILRQISPLVVEV